MKILCFQLIKNCRTSRVVDFDRIRDDVTVVFLSIIVSWYIFFALLQFRRLQHQRLLPTRGGQFNPESAGFRRSHLSHVHRFGHIILIPDRRKEAAKKPWSANKTAVRLHTSTPALFHPPHQRSNWSFLFLSAVKLTIRKRTQQNSMPWSVPLERDLRTNGGIQEYFAQGRTNGPGPVRPYRYSLVQPTAAAGAGAGAFLCERKKLEYSVFPSMRFTFFVQSDLKSLTFFCDTMFEYFFFFKGL